MVVIADGSAKFIIRDKRIQTMIDMFYPVGSVYISADGDKEKEDFPFMQYGTWVEITGGLVLQTVINGKEVGSTVKAGLPNIKGTTGMHLIINSNTKRCTAPFYWETKSGYTYAGIVGSNAVTSGVAMDASLSNSIYGNSDTVQPPAFLVRAWRRTA